MNYLRNLEKRKEEVIRLIDEQGKLTEELEEKIRNAAILQEVEDLYLPYRQKRRTRATKAKEKGLEPLAQLIWEQDTFSGSLEEYGKSYLDPEKELNNLDEVYQGARDIIAEWISDDAEIRKAIREYSYEKGVLESTVKKQELDEEGKYELYYEYKEAARKLPPHRVLAINRGEKEEILSVKLVLEEEKVYGIIKKRVQKNTDNIFTDQLILALEDAYKRLIAPSIEREIRNSLTERQKNMPLRYFPGT